MAKAFPSEEVRKRIKGMGLDPVREREALDAEKGDLLRLDYFRLVLDEAHAIKNQYSRSKRIPPTSVLGTC